MDKHATVFIIVEDTNQGDFSDHYGDSASPSSKVLHVFADKDQAEAKKAALEREDTELVKKFGTDPCDYRIVEKEVE